MKAQIKNDKLFITPSNEAEAKILKPWIKENIAEYGSYGLSIKNIDISCEIDEPETFKICGCDYTVDEIKDAMRLFRIIKTLTIAEECGL